MFLPVTSILIKLNFCLEVVEVADQDITQTVISMVADRMDVDESQITDDTHFVNDLQADSLDMAELVIDLEEEFGLEISDEQAQEIGTVGEAIKFISENQ